MKYLLILLLFISCKKPDEKVIVSAYHSDIQQANFNEPKTLYWFVVDESNENYYIATNTDFNRSVESLSFERRKGFPIQIYKHGGFIKNLTINRNLIYK